jgi:hypothetical protein
MKKLNKKADFDFVWLFAILAGAAILILAIYGATKGADTLKYQSDTQLAKSLSVVLGPLQAGFSDSLTNTVSFQQETKIINYCSDSAFGSNELSISTKDGKDWTPQSGEIKIRNQYVFSSETSGKRFEVLSRPFNFPFKVGDLLFINSGAYCIEKLPKELEKEIKSLNLNNFQIENCSENIPTICFGSGSCDINVYGTCAVDCKTKYDEGYVEKVGEKLYFVGSLMYGAIFSDKEVYECNVKRLIFRAKTLSEILAEKASLMDSRGCSTNIQPELIFWASTLNKTNLTNIIDKNDFAKSLEEKQKSERCKSW